MKGPRAMNKTAIFGLCLAALGLTGCAGAFDSYQKPGNWVEEGSANETIAQQAAYPGDLIHGQSDPMSDGIAASAGVDKAIGANGADTATGLQTAATAISAGASQ
jgi:hypothetical protein